MSCTERNQLGIWKTIDDGSFYIFYITQENITIKNITDFNYHHFSKEWTLERISPQSFENDSLKIELSESNLEILLYKNNILVDSNLIAKLDEFNLDTKKDELKNLLVGKSAEIKSDTFALGKFDFFQNKIAFSILDTFGTIQTIQSDIFQIGKELFFIPNDQFPIPIQISEVTEERLNGIALYGNGIRKAEIKIEELPNRLQIIEGKWKFKDSIELILELKDNQMILYFDEDPDTLNYEIMSDKKHIAVTREPKHKSFMLKTTINNNGDLEIRDYRRRKNKDKTIIYERIKNGM